MDTYFPQGLQGKESFTPSIGINAAKTLLIQLSLKSIESLENGLPPRSEAIPICFYCFQ